MGTTFTGNGCLHDSVLGLGLTVLIDDGVGRSALAEKSAGAGHIMFGGMTTTNFHSANSAGLRVNMLQYGASFSGALAAAAVPAPATLGLMSMGLVGLGLRRRRMDAR